MLDRRAPSRSLGDFTRIDLYDLDGRLENPHAFAEGFAPEITPRPLRLHTQQVEQGGPMGGLGGHCFSADFARYLARVKPTLTEAEERAVAYWWASHYGQQRVAERFVRAFGREQGLSAFGREQGLSAYRAALALASRYWDYSDAIAATGYSANRLGKFVSLARQYAFQPSASVVVSATTAAVAMRV